MIMTQERMILKGQAQLDEMTAFVRKAAKDGRPIDQVERSLWQSLLALATGVLLAVFGTFQPLEKHGIPAQMILMAQECHKKRQRQEARS